MSTKKPAKIFRNKLIRDWSKSIGGGGGGGRGTTEHLEMWLIKKT